jgi:adenylate kinase
MNGSSGTELRDDRDNRDRRHRRPRSAVILLGPPGSGKTTVADRLDSLPGLRAVVTGRLLRQATENEDPRGDAVRDSIEHGSLVSTETVTNVLVREISGFDEDTLVFDGYPRSAEQVDYFFRMLENLGLRFAAVVVLDVSPEVSSRRLAGRHRMDDSRATVAERRVVYERETVPLIESLRRRFPDHVHRVSAEHPIEDVVRSVLEVLARVGAVTRRVAPESED